MELTNEVYKKLQNIPQVKEILKDCDQNCIIFFISDILYKLALNALNTEIMLTRDHLELTDLLSNTTYTLKQTGNSLTLYQQNNIIWTLNIQEQTLLSSTFVGNQNERKIIRPNCIQYMEGENGVVFGSLEDIGINNKGKHFYQYTDINKQRIISIHEDEAGQLTYQDLFAKLIGETKNQVFKKRILTKQKQGK